MRKEPIRLKRRFVPSSSFLNVTGCVVKPSKVPKQAEVPIPAVVVERSASPESLPPRAALPLGTLYEELRKQEPTTSTGAMIATRAHNDSLRKAQDDDPDLDIELADTDDELPDKDHSLWPWSRGNSWQEFEP